MTLYTDFVKLQMARLDKSVLFKDRMAMIAKLWKDSKEDIPATVKKEPKAKKESKAKKEHKKKEPKGGSYEDHVNKFKHEPVQHKLSKSLQNQLIQKDLYSGGDVVAPPVINTSSYWIYPIPAEYRGVPSYLFQHPNKYSGGKSQVMIYSSFENFMNTDFYNNNKINLKTITPPPQFARGSSSSEWFDYVVIKYGKILRVIFAQGNIAGKGVVGIENNYNSYYIDCVDINDYVNILSQIYKDRDNIVPTEQAAIMRMQINKDAAQSQYTQSQADYTRGMTDQSSADQVEAQQAQQAQAADNDDSSDMWGTLSTIGEIAVAFI